MRLLSLSPILLLAGVLAAPGALTASGSAVTPSAPAVQADDAHPLAIFPMPSADLEIQISGDATPSLADVLMRFEAISAHNLQMSQQTLQELRALSTGLSSSVKVPASEVYSYVSALLYNSGFLLAETRSAEPRILSVFSVNSNERGRVRNFARAIDASDVARYERHPALIVQTVISLSNMDARQLSNSMRVVITDSNLQQITAVSEKSLVLIGNGPQVADWIRLIRGADSNETPDPAPEPSGAEK